MEKTISTPPSYDLIHKKNLILLLKGEYKDLLIRQGIEELKTFLGKYGQTSPDLIGRTPLISVCLSDGESVVIRHYSHGGLLRFLTGGLYLFGTRSFQELALTEEIRSAGIPTVQPIGAVHYRVFPFFYKAYLLSLEIPDVRDAVRYLLKMGSHPSGKDLLKKRERIRSAGRLVQQFHQAGFYHTDLQLKNILVGRDRAYLIDFDRCYRKKILTLRERIDNLLRLNRSVEKWKRLGLPLTRTDRWRFFLAYSGDDPEVRKALRKRLRTNGIRFLPHRWIWAIQEWIKK